MNIPIRAYLTAGIAALSAGAIAVSPIQPVPNHLAAAQQHAVSTLSVNLAATVNPIAAWVDTFQTTAANLTTLAIFALQQPFPIATTLIHNWSGYLTGLLSGDITLEGVFDQIGTNFQTLFKAPFDPGDGYELPAVPPDFPEAVFIPTGEYVSKTRLPVVSQDVAPTTLAGLAVGAWDACVTGFDTNGCAIPSQVGPISSVLSSYGSGMLIAALGPVLAPLLSLGNSVEAVFANLKEGKVLDALYEVLNIPANMTNAFLNGGPVLDLTKLVADFLPLPVDPIGIRLGGLLNAVPFNGSLQPNLESPITEYSGGTAFDAIYAPNIPLGVPGLPIGLGGSLVGMGQYLAEKLKVTPPAPTAAVAPAAAVNDAPAAEAEAPAPAVADIPAPAAEDASAVAAEVDAPAPQAVSAPAARQRVASADNGDNAAGGRAHHSGARGKNGRG